MRWSSVLGPHIEMVIETSNCLKYHRLPRLILNFLGTEKAEVLIWRMATLFDLSYITSVIQTVPGKSTTYHYLSIDSSSKRIWVDKAVPKLQILCNICCGEAALSVSIGIQLEKDQALRFN